MRHVFIAECVGSPATSLDLLSRWRDGTRQAPFTRKLAGTPCELVLAHGAQCFTNDVTSLFPGDPLLAASGAVGYFGAPLFDSGGRALGVLAVIDDRPIERTDEREDLLTVSAARASVELQRSRFEREIRRLNADLERRVADRTAELRSANRELEAFSYSVSHDLRAPVRHITGFVDRLRQHAAGMPAAGREYIDDIATAAGADVDAHRHAARVLPARPAATCRRAVVDLTELANSVVAELTKEAPDRRVEWRIGVVPLVRGDRHLLRQVLVNLLGNAFKYSRGRDVARIELGTAPGSPSGDVVLFVRDNGVGFDMKYASRLFGVFQRLHAAKDFEGTGIGLANVHQIVTRHGGHVWAEAAVNAGATFFVSLPPGRRARSRPPPDAAALTMDFPIAVLHLEDSAADAKLVAGALVDDGLDCAITLVDNEADYTRRARHASLRPHPLGPLAAGLRRHRGAAAGACALPRDTRSSRSLARSARNRRPRSCAPARPITS